MDESNVGVNSHTDSTFITILHQRVDGLEVKLKDGEWFGIDASPLFCVIAGDAFMVSFYHSSINILVSIRGNMTILISY